MALRPAVAGRLGAELAASCVDRIPCGAIAATLRSSSTPATSYVASRTRLLRCGRTGLPIGGQLRRFRHHGLTLPFRP